MTGNFSGWFRDVPEPPAWASQEDVRNQSQWNTFALRRLPQWQTMAKPRPGRRKPPCMGIGIFVDDNQHRFAMVAISGDGTYTEEMINARVEGERFAFDFKGTDLHAEQRLARTAVEMRRLNAEAIAQGRPPPFPPGVRLESVAASFPICRRLCVPELTREGTKPLTEIEPEPPPSPTAPPDNPRPALGYEQTQRRGRKPRR